MFDHPTIPAVLLVLSGMLVLYDGHVSGRGWDLFQNDHHILEERMIMDKFRSDEAEMTAVHLLSHRRKRNRDLSYTETRIKNLMANAILEFDKASENNDLAGVLAADSALKQLAEEHITALANLVRGEHPEG